MYRILIAENEPRIAEFIKKGLSANGYVVEIEFNGYKTLLRTLQGMYDLLILDLELPDKNGLESIEELRGQGETLPIIIVSRRTDVRDKVLGLETGADDYLTKPFRFEELLARIKVQLRDRPGSQSRQTETQLRVGELTLDLITRHVWIGNRNVELSAREFVLAEVLLRHPMQVMSKEQLLNRVWGYDYDPGSNIIEVYIRHLRKKLGSGYIETVRGMGYRLKIGQ